MNLDIKSMNASFAGSIVLMSFFLTNASFAGYGGGPNPDTACSVELAKKYPAICLIESWSIKVSGSSLIVTETRRASGSLVEDSQGRRAILTAQHCGDPSGLTCSKITFDGHPPIYTTQWKYPPASVESKSDDRKIRTEVDYALALAEKYLGGQLPHTIEPFALPELRKTGEVESPRVSIFGMPLPIVAQFGGYGMDFKQLQGDKKILAILPRESKEFSLLRFIRAGPPKFIM